VSSNTAWAKSRGTVMPMPHSRLTPTMWRQVVRSGKLHTPRPTMRATPRVMPAIFPTVRAETMASTTATALVECQSEAVKVTPALASTNSGRMT